MKIRPRFLLVADAGSARMFRIDSTRGALVETPEWEIFHEVLPARDLVSDRPGRGARPGGSEARAARHQKGPSTDPHRLEKARFAHTVAGKVEEQRTHNRLAALAIAAPPKMLGDLRNEFSPEVRNEVCEEFPKDLAMLKPDEIGARLPTLFSRQT